MTNSVYTPVGHLVLRLPGARRVLVHRRGAVVSALIAIVALVIAVITLLTGPYDLSAQGALDVLTGGGASVDRFVVLDQRLPRVIAASLVGFALAGSGAIFQSVSRNPLGSPDLVGFTTGAATGGLLALIVIGSTSWTILLGTLIGGFATALVVMLLSSTGGLRGDRLVLSGVAVAAILSSVNDYLLTRADLETAETAKSWQHGSLNAITWTPILPLAITLALVVPLVAVVQRGLHYLELGDDVAASCGVRVDATRWAAMTLGVALAAVGVATAGPIGFLALAAPHIAGHLTKTPGIRPLPAMATGALLLLAADLLAARLLSPFPDPRGAAHLGPRRRLPRLRTHPPS